jgi:CubicO group peptidase (beta-lactamase class C family)
LFWNVTDLKFARFNNMYRRAFLQSVAGVPLVQLDQPASFERDVLDWLGTVPGVLVGVVKDGKPGWVKGLGLAKVEEKVAVGPETIFHAASLSKQVTAYAAFALKLDLDRTLVSYVDDLKDPQARTVTVRQVLSHSSGFPNWRSKEGEELVPKFKPGTKFQYSGEGFFYLQRILEKVSGKSICEVVEDLVFRPLGMASSSMAWRPEWMERVALPYDAKGVLRQNWDRPPRVLRAYAQKAGERFESWKYERYSAVVKEVGGTMLPNGIVPNAAASMVTSGADYVKFLAAAMRNSELTRQVTRINENLGWGLGWGVERVGNREFLWQWGDNGGFKHIVFAEPGRGEGIFVFTNGDAGGKVYRQIVKSVSGVEHPAFAWL